MSSSARSVSFACWCAIALAGCSAAGTTTELMVQVTYSGGLPAPSTVSISVFDGYGLIGHKDLSPAPLPGQLTVAGLADRASELRIAAVGTSLTQKLLGAARVTLVPRQRVTTSITLAVGTPDGDGDGVPDTIDDCPAVPDATQADATGVPPGDACRGAPAGDLAFDFATGTSDLAAADLAAADLAAADLAPRPTQDLATAGPDMRPASNCGALTTFCDGFEGTGFLPHWSAILQNGGTASIDTTRSYRGASSLHLYNAAIGATGTSDVALEETSTFAQHFYLRAFVYVPSGFPSSTADIFFTEQNVSPYQGITLNLLNGSFQTNDTIAGGGTLNSTTPMPTNTWVCLEWNVQLGSSGTPNGSTSLSVGGVTATNLGGAQPLYSTTPINTIGVMLIGGPNTPARDVWLDEVVIDTQPIGCLK